MRSSGSFLFRAVFFLIVCAIAGAFYSLKPSWAQAPSPIQQKPADVPQGQGPAPALMPPVVAPPAAQPSVALPPVQPPVSFPAVPVSPPADLPPLKSPGAALVPSPAPSAPVMPVASVLAGAVNAPALQPDKSETEMLLGKISALEERVGVLEKNMASAGAGAAASAPEVAVKKRPAIVRRHKKTSPPPPRWVLKSAKPGIAWVAKRGSDELQTISVGEQLPGLGRITAIAKDSMGQWVVNGTKGRVSQ